MSSKRQGTVTLTNKTGNKEFSESIVLEEDMTGRDKLARNVIIGWGSYLLVFISGFILPRMMDQYVGQVLLGIWDFSWSIVNYMIFVAPGIGSGINRFVAKYRAAKETDKLCEAVSTVVLMQMMVSMIIITMVTIIVSNMGFFFGDTIGKDLHTAQKVVSILGAAVAIQMIMSPSRGVLTGCHRWDLLNGLQALSSLLSVGTMIIVLVMGGDLVNVALAYLITNAIMEVMRAIVSFRVCPELTIRPRLASMQHARKILLFGGKTIVVGLPMLLIAQTTSILVAMNLGPAAVAVFARPLSLVRHLQTFVTKFSFMMTPTAGALQELGDKNEIRDFLLQVTRYAVAFTLPSVLLLVVYGDVLLRAWMGDNYAHWSLMAILAMGYFLPISQDPVIRTLMGMNAHGRVAFQSLFAGIISFSILAVIGFQVGWSLDVAATVVAISLSITSGIVIPVFACKMFEIPYHQYVLSTFKVPVLCAIPYLLVLVALRYFLEDHLLLAFFLSGLIGGLVILSLYWRYIFTESARNKVKSKFGFGNSKVAG